VAAERTTESVFGHALERTRSRRARAELREPALRETGRYEADIRETGVREAGRFEQPGSPTERADRPSGRRTPSVAIFQAALSAASDRVMLVDRAGTIVYANPAAEALVGHSSLQGRRLADVCMLRRRTLSTIWRALRRGGRWAGRLPRQPDDTASPLLDIDMTVQRVASESDGPDCDDYYYCLVLHAEGRAPNRELERPSGEPARRARGVTAEAVCALQRMASEIAHDVNNQIAVVLNYTFVLLRQMPDDSPLKVHVAEMQAAAWRASRVAQTIRALQQHPALQSSE
jgi:PAS domain-containing protein